MIDDSGESAVQRYESCVIGSDGRCTRWSHDHDGESTAAVMERRPCPSCRHGGYEVYGKWHPCGTCEGSMAVLYDRCGVCNSLHNRRPAPAHIGSNAVEETG